MPGADRGARQPDDPGIAPARPGRAGKPAADHPRPPWPGGRRRVRTFLPLSRPRAGLADVGFDPFRIGIDELVDRPGDDARHVVAMERGDAGHQRIGLTIGGLEDGRDLLRRLDRSLPTVDGPDGPEDIDAGGEPLLDHPPADALRLIGVGEYRIDGDNAHEGAVA